MWLDPKNSAGPPLAGNTPISNVYSSNNQRADAGYDTDGNQTVVNGNTLGYDAENRVVSDGARAFRRRNGNPRL